jgi:CubicO group peptidase (beta-lactamase class C family)
VVAETRSGVDSVCCTGLAGNIDSDPDGITDIGDLTVLIAYLYIPPNPAPLCLAEANIDGDLAGVVDIGDLTALIAYLYIPPNVSPSECVYIPDPDAPIIAQIPDQVLVEGLTFSAISLDDYVSDSNHSDSEIVWTAYNDSALTVDIIDRVAAVVLPGSDWIGEETVIFRATDPDGLWAACTTSFEIFVPAYKPLELEDLSVSTPTQEGLDPSLVYQIYQCADTMPHLFSVLILKNGQLVAEQYFNGKYVDVAAPTASVTKSYISALTGIALQQGDLTSLDQHMADFFPEYWWQFTDPRKYDITLRQVLQMRSGYVWEERSPTYLQMFMNTNNWLNLLGPFPLTSDPGTQFGYSNLTAHAMAVILARAADMPLRDYAQTHLFDHLGYTCSFWPRDAQNNHVGHGDLYIRPRDMAKFGQMYLDSGMYNGVQVLTPEWIAESFQVSTANAFGGRVLWHLHPIDYGYLWWKAQAGSHVVHYAWGHGGQVIAVVYDLNMVVVTTADNLLGDFTQDGWLLESSVLELVGRLIASIE